MKGANSKQPLQTTMQNPADHAQCRYITVTALAHTSLLTGCTVAHLGPGGDGGYFVFFLHRTMWIKTMKLPWDNKEPECIDFTCLWQFSMHENLTRTGKEIFVANNTHFCNLANCYQCRNKSKSAGQGCYQIPNIGTVHERCKFKTAFTNNHAKSSWPCPV